MIMGNDNHLAGFPPLSERDAWRFLQTRKQDADEHYRYLCESVSNVEERERLWQCYLKEADAFAAECQRTINEERERRYVECHDDNNSNSNHGLTDDQVKAIRSSTEEGFVLAQRYQVTTYAIAEIRYRKKDR